MNENQQYALRLLDLLLASERKKGRQQRGTALLCRAEPLEGYVHLTSEHFCRGWAFQLGSPRGHEDVFDKRDAHFAKALDITFDRRMRDKKPYYVWTQGTAFHFRRGYTIHRADDRLLIQMEDARGAAPAGNDSPRDPGFARVQFYVPGSEGRIWQKDKLRDITQDELVRFLIDGQE